MITAEYYNEKSSEFIQKYDKVNMSSLHELLLKEISTNSNVLDIGFGSGRDLQFLHDNNCNIWGIDSSKEFVQNALQRFPTRQRYFFKAHIPFDKKLFEIDVKFDLIICIAIWMHLEHSEYEAAVHSIVSVTKPNSTIVISYSKGERTDDPRYFEKVDLAYIIDLFKKSGFKLVKNTKNKDSLNRNNLNWITVVFKHEEQQSTQN